MAMLLNLNNGVFDMTMDPRIDIYNCDIRVKFMFKNSSVRKKH